MLCFALELRHWKQINLGLVYPLFKKTDTCGEWHLQRFMPSLCPETLRYTEWEENVLLQGQNPSMTSKVKGHHFSLGEFITVKMTSSICLLHSLSWDEQKKVSSPFRALFFRGIIFCRTCLQSWIKLSLRNIWDLSKSWKSNIFLPIFIKDSKKGIYPNVWQTDEIILERGAVTHKSDTEIYFFFD